MKKGDIFISNILILLLIVILNGCQNLESPYYVSKRAMKVKNLEIPVGSILRYNTAVRVEECEKLEPLNEKYLSYIEFPGNNLLIWGGMPVQVIAQYEDNRSNKGFTVYPSLYLTENDKKILARKSEFIKLWFQWEQDMEVDIKNENDWSFNPDNMVLGGDADITNISINISNFRVVRKGIYDVEATNRKLQEHKRKLNEAAKKVKNSKLKYTK